MPKKSKIDEIEEIGENLPKSEKTKAFVKKVRAQSEETGAKAKPKKEKAKAKDKKEPIALSDIPGVGAKLAKRIIDGGFKTAEEIAELEPADLADIKGVGSPEKAEALIEAARGLTGNKPAKKKAKEPEPAVVKKAPPLRVRVQIPPGEIGFLMPDELDNSQFQPRAAFAELGLLDVPEELVRNIRRHRGNIQAILAVKATEPELVEKGVKAVVIDGHRRVEAIRRINFEVEPDQQLTVKAEVIEVDPAEAAVIALDVNLDAERLSESERDKWIYSLMIDHGMTDDQIAETTGLAKPTLSNIRRVFEQAPKQVIELLDKGEVSTGHVKAVVSLPDSDQKRIIKKAAKKDLSVREVEAEAKQAKGKESTIEHIMDFLKSKYADQETHVLPTEIPVQDVAAFYGSVVKDAFTNGTEGALARYGHWPHDADVRTALRRLGMKAIETPREKGVEKPEPEVPLCNGCVAFVEGLNKCLWTANDRSIRPPKFVECPMFLAGPRYSRHEMKVCPHCNVPVWRPDVGVAPTYKSLKGVVHVSGSGGYRFDDPVLKGETIMLAHTGCLFSYLAKANHITGACLDCNNEDCNFMAGVSKWGRHMKGSLHVEKCDKQKPGFDVDKYNNETREAWTEAIKAQAPEPEPEPKKEEPPEISAETAE